MHNALIRIGSIARFVVLLHDVRPGRITALSTATVIHRVVTRGMNLGISSRKSQANDDREESRRVGWNHKMLAVHVGTQCPAANGIALNNVRVLVLLYK